MRGIHLPLILFFYLLNCKEEDMLVENVDQKFVKFTTSAWGFWLLIVLPLLNMSVYFAYVINVDIEWLYASKLVKTFDSQISQQILAKKLDHGTLWHWAKLALWPSVLYQIKILLVAVFAVSFAQFFNTKISIKKILLISLWSHITLVIGIVASLSNIVSADKPLRMYLIDLDPFSWNRIFRLEGDGPLQFFTSFENPTIFLNVFILAYLFKRLSHSDESVGDFEMGWMTCFLFATLPYLTFLGLKYHIFGIVLTS